MLGCDAQRFSKAPAAGLAWTFHRHFEPPPTSRLARISKAGEAIVTVSGANPFTMVLPAGPESQVNSVEEAHVRSYVPARKGIMLIFMSV